jgi:hypothetical protein
MNFFSCLRRRALIAALATAVIPLMVSGCGGGWGEKKPVLSSGQSGTQSQSQTVIAGQPVTFTATPQGQGPFSFQWFMNGKLIPGGSGSSYTVPSASGNDNGAIFTVAVSNPAGTVMSPPYTLTVDTPPVITMQPASQTVAAGQPATFTVAATGTAPLSYQWYENGIANSSPSTTLNTPANMVSSSGSVFTVTVSNMAGTATSSPATLTVNPLVPILSFAPIAAQTYGNPAVAVSAGSVSNGAVTYSVVSGPATIAGNAVSMDGTGIVVLHASQAASGNYAAATATVSFPVAPETPQLSFSPIASQAFSTTPMTVHAVSTSTGAITYSVASGPATITGNQLTMTGLGTVVLNASQPASGNYAAATATVSFPVTPEAPQLSFLPISSQVFSTTPVTVHAVSTSTGAITYSVASGPATIAGNQLTMTGLGTVMLNASQVATGNYAAASTSTSFVVAAIIPSLQFASINPQTYGNAAFPVSASSASPGLVTYSVVSGPVSLAGNVLTITGAGPVVLQANQAASGGFGPASATVSFTVAPEVPSLTFTTINPQTYGAMPFAVTAISASNGAVTYRVISGPATISSNMVSLTNAGAVTLGASQAAAGNYAAATTTTSFNVTAHVMMAPISPANQTFAPGVQTFSATVTGGPTDTVTWTATGGSIDASGNWTSPNTPGTYTIRATSVDETSIYQTTTVVISRPVITTQPVSQSLCSNGNLSLSITASYVSSYQWYLNGTLIPGATSATYMLPGANTADGGSYMVVVSNGAGSVTSAGATVQVGSSILTNPSSLIVTQYQTAGFNVAAGGKSPFTYQWYSVPYGSTASAIAGATASTYITPVQSTTTTAGQPVGYYVKVTDACGSVLTSATADLTVDSGNSPPTITVQPTGQTVPVGAPATFSAAAVGSGTLSYQWYKIAGGGTNQEIEGVTPVAGTAVSGGTSASYTVPGTVTATGNDQDSYYLVVKNAYGQAVSQHATLAVANGIQLQITDEPVNAYVNPGAAASFTVVANSTLPMTYQWYMVPPGQSAAQQTVSTTTGMTTLPASAVSIEGADSATFTVASAASSQTGTVYYVVVSNGQTSSVVSNAAALFVGTPAGIPNCSSGWSTLGTTMPFDSASCSYQLTAATTSQYGEIVWPTLISTANVKLSFTIATSNTSSKPADGFAMVLGDPSLGATVSSAGGVGEGLGARGIPGFVLAFDDYYNTACTSSCSPAPFPSDPSSSSNPDYLGVGRGEDSLWENPYFNANTSLPGGRNALAEYGSTITHSYVVSIVQGYMSVTMDGTQVFSGNVSVPPVAYLYVTASTGGSFEQTVISNIAATVSAPSN